MEPHYSVNAIDFLIGIKEVFKEYYYLSKRDCDTLVRLMNFTMGQGRLTKTEHDKWIKVNVINPETDKVTVPIEFVFAKLIMPSFWLKCLLKYHEVL